MEVKHAQCTQPHLVIRGINASVDVAPAARMRALTVTACCIHNLAGLRARKRIANGGNQQANERAFQPAGPQTCGTEQIRCHLDSPCWGLWCQRDHHRPCCASCNKKSSH